MDRRQTDLWNKLQTFEFDDAASSLTYSKRLARENAWTLAYAKKVIEEYRRFIFLMMEAGHPVTPSDEVDQAWHLHMVYTRSYWDDLCEGVLGRSLDHGPTTGGEAEDDKYEDWYEKTLESYERLFGEKPPREVWPSAKERFAGRYVRVDTRRHWVVGTKGLAHSVMWMTAMIIGCVITAIIATNTRSHSGFMVLIMAGLIAAGLIGSFIFLWPQAFAGHRTQANGGTGCSGAVFGAGCSGSSGCSGGGGGGGGGGCGGGGD